MYIRTLGRHTSSPKYKEIKKKRRQKEGDHLAQMIFWEEAALKGVQDQYPWLKDPSQYTRTAVPWYKGQTRVTYKHLFTDAYYEILVP